MSSMTGQLQEKPPEPGPRHSHPLPRSRCEGLSPTTVVSGPYLRPGEDVGTSALLMTCSSQQGPLSPATLTDMSAVE